MLTGLCLGVVKLPAADVFGSILPALGVALLLGNVYYTYLARRLASKEGRDRRHGACPTARACRTCSSSSS